MSSPTSSSLVLLEHLNFKIPIQGSENSIIDFFVTRLGAPECATGRLRVAEEKPGNGVRIPVGEAKQMHVNMGLSQIHFEWCTGAGVPYEYAQRLQGYVTIAMDDLDALIRRVHDYPYKLICNDTVILLDPFGNTWNCIQGTAKLAQTIANFPVQDIRAGGVGHVLGIVAVDFDVPLNVSKGIVDFYQDTFGARTQVIAHGHAVWTRAGQMIRFNETPSAPPPNAYDVSPLYSLHMCIYIDRYEEIVKTLYGKGLLWINPDYIGPPINDKVADVNGAVTTGQFRVKQCGKTGWVFEHEIRSGHHRLCPKGLVGKL